MGVSGPTGAPGQGPLFLCPLPCNHLTSFLGFGWHHDEGTPQGTHMGSRARQRPPMVIGGSHPLEVSTPALWSGMGMEKTWGRVETFTLPGASVINLDAVYPCWWEEGIQIQRLWAHFVGP